MESSRKPDAGSSGRFTTEALARVLREELRLSPDAPLYVAYSGGMDSHVLLHALASSGDRPRSLIHAVHIDHAIHRDSYAWSRHCAEVCNGLGVSYRSERVVVENAARYGLEEAARRARYAALRRLLPAGAVLLTAHHRSDQAETLLLQLLRGAGVPGLAAMPMIASFGAARLARPLLGFTRAALAAYADAHALHWIEDPSNTDTRFARNFLRVRAMPMLVQRWPQTEENLVRAARHQSEAARLLDDLARIDLSTAQVAEGELSIAGLCALSRERQANLVRFWLRSSGVATPSQRVLDQILMQARREPVTRHAAVVWGEAEVRRYRDRLVLRREVPAAAHDWEAHWEPGAVLSLPGGLQLRTLERRGAGLSCARIAGKKLRVRLRRGGERCLLRGHHHKVKKLLQAAGVPPWERASMPFVYANDELAAVGTQWIADPYAACAGEAGFMLIVERAAARSSG